MVGAVLSVSRYLLIALFWVAFPLFLTLYSAVRRHPMHGYKPSEYILAGVVLLSFSLIISMWSWWLTLAVGLYYLALLLVISRLHNQLGAGAGESDRIVRRGSTEPVTARFVRVKPSSERPIPEDIVSFIGGLQNIDDGFTRRLNPFKLPPKFEMLIVSPEGDQPIEFLFRPENDEHFEALKSGLRVDYPRSFDIEEVTVDLTKALLPNKIYNQRYRHSETGSNTTGSPKTSSSSTDLDDILNQESDDLFADGGYDDMFLHEGETETENNDLSPMDFQGVDVHGVHWFGKEERRQDWQTLTRRYTLQTKRQRQKEDTKRKVRASPLAHLLEEFSAIEEPVVFQAVFQRRRNWQHRAESRKARLKNGMDTPLSAISTAIGTLLEEVIVEESSSTSEEKEDVNESAGEKVDDSGMESGARQDLITNKDPSLTFKVNLRCLTFVPEDAPDSKQTELNNKLDAVSNAFNHLSGPYYGITGRVVNDGFRQRFGKYPSRKDLLRDFLSGNIRVTLLSRTRLQLILNHDELSNYISVPCNDALTTDATREIRSPIKSRAPLPLPDPDTLEAYTKRGLEIGVPLNEHREPDGEPIRVPPSVLHHHYVRSGVTGSGKSIAAINELLSFTKYTSGPNILIEPKGGDMVANYLQAHYAEHGSLEDIVYFNVPDELPGMPLFDIRPYLQAGVDRVDAIQSAIKRIEESIKIVMEEGEYETAQVSVYLLKAMIRANFDYRYGKDAFTFEEIEKALIELRDSGRVPNVAEEHQYLADNIDSMVGEDQFQNVVDGALNRLHKLTEDPRLRDMYDHLPEWSLERADLGAPFPPIDGSGFHFYNHLYENKTIIFDVGDLDKAASKAISLIILGNLWAAIKMERQGVGRDVRKPDDYVIGCIVEEAKDLADADILEDLLSWGREFGLCLGLVMQYPKQMQGEDAGSTVYDEIMQNTGTKILGPVRNASRIADMLSHDQVTAEEIQNRFDHMSGGEWIVSLKEPDYFDYKPLPFSVKSLPPPEGHSVQGGLARHQEQKFESEQERLTSVVVERYCVPSERRKHANRGTQSFGTADTQTQDSPTPDVAGFEDLGGPAQPSNPSQQEDKAEPAENNNSRGLGSYAFDANSSSDSQQSRPSKANGGSHHSSPPDETTANGGTAKTQDNDSSTSDDSMLSTDPADLGDITDIQFDTAVKDSTPANPDTYEKKDSTSQSSTPEKRTSPTGQPTPSHSEQQREQPEQTQEIQPPESLRDVVDNPFGDDKSPSQEQSKQNHAHHSNRRSPKDHNAPGEGQNQDAVPETTADSNKLSPSSTSNQSPDDVGETQSNGPSGRESAESNDVEIWGGSSLDVGRDTDSKRESSSEERTRLDGDLTDSMNPHSRPTANQSTSTDADHTINTNESVPHPESNVEPAGATPTENTTSDAHSPSKESKRDVSVSDVDPFSYQESAGAPYAARLSTSLDSHPLDVGAIKFLGEIYEVYKNPARVDYYDFPTTMTQLREYEKEVAEDLVNEGYLIKQSYLRRRTYYSLTAKAYNILDVDPLIGENLGDLGEQGLHRVACHLVAEIWSQNPKITDVVRYAERGDVTYDVLALSNDTPVWVAEIETGSNDRVSMTEDYEKLNRSSANAYWVFDNKETMNDVIDAVQSQRGGYSSVKTGKRRSYDDVRADLVDSDEGHSLYGLSEIIDLVEGGRDE